VEEGWHAVRLQGRRKEKREKEIKPRGAGMDKEEVGEGKREGSDGQGGESCEGEGEGDRVGL